MFVLNGKAYVCGGNPLSPPYLNDLWEYDPLLDTWQQRSDMPATGRSAAIAFAAYGKGYVGSGNDDSANFSSKDFWEWDPTLDAWTQRADVPGSESRTGCAFVINGTPYAGGGWDGTDYLVDFHAYDASTNTWTPIPNYGGAGAYTPVAYAIGNKGYVGTGGTSGGSSDQYWEFDPGSTIGIQDLPEMYAITPFLCDGQINLNGRSTTAVISYAIFDGSGRIVSSGSLKQAVIKLPLLPAAAYVLQMVGTNGISRPWPFVIAN